MSRRSLVPLLSLVTIGALLVGCSSDDREAGPGTHPATSSTGPVPSTDTPTATPSASGERIDMEALSFTLPADYAPEGSRTPTNLGARGKAQLSLDTLAVVTVDNFGDPSDLSQAIQTHLDFSGYQREPRTLEPVTVDGVEMYHLAGRTDALTWVEAFGSDSTSDTIDIQFEFSVEDTAAQREEVVASVLDSVDMK